LRSTKMTKYGVMQNRYLVKWNRWINLPSLYSKGKSSEYST
jgi:hypothetical protein